MQAIASRAVAFVHPDIDAGPLETMRKAKSSGPRADDDHLQGIGFHGLGLSLGRRVFAGLGKFHCNLAKPGFAPGQFAGLKVGGDGAYPNKLRAIGCA